MTKKETIGSNKKAYNQINRLMQRVEQLEQQLTLLQTRVMQLEVARWDYKPPAPTMPVNPWDSPVYCNSIASHIRGGRPQ